MIVRQNGMLKVIPQDGLKGTNTKDTVVFKARDTMLKSGISLVYELLGQSNDQQAFILLVSNDAISASVILAACELNHIIVLVPFARKCDLVEYIARQTGITRVMDLQNRTITPKSSSNSPQWLKSNSIKRGGVCMLTSGSTGLPKIVFCTWESMISQGLATQVIASPNGPFRFICASSIAHAYAINALFAIYASPYGNNSELYLDLDSNIEVLSTADEMPTFLYGTPGTYIKLCTLAKDISLKHMKAFSAGVSLQESLKQTLFDRFELQVFQNYGSTETGGIAVDGLFESSIVDLTNTKLQHVGSPWPNVKIRIEKPESTRICNEVEKGEIIVLTPWQCTGYVNNETLVSISHDGYYHTGDGGVYDTSDHLFIGERLRQPIHLISNGLDVFVPPQQIERAFLNHSFISDVLVPHLIHTTDTININPIIFVVSATLSLDKIIAFRNNILPSLFHGLEIRKVDFLPCSAAGKLMYCFQL